jgi:hypothetical protein
MPSAPADPERLLATSAALARLRDVARHGADEALGHYTELGDRETQTILDGYLDQVADALREIDAAASDLAGRLRVAAHSSEARAGSTVGSKSHPAPKGVFR